MDKFALEFFKIHEISYVVGAMNDSHISIVALDYMRLIITIVRYFILYHYIVLYLAIVYFGILT